MKKFSLSTVTNTLTLLFITFVISFFIFRYFMKTYPSLVLSLSLAISLSFLYVTISTSYKKKKLKKQQEENDIEQCLIELNFLTQKELISLFQKAFSFKNIRTVQRPHGLYLKDENKYIYFAFGFNGVDKKDVVKAYNTKADKTEIFAYEYSPEIKAFAKRFSTVSLAEKKKIFSVLKDADLVPTKKHILLNDKENSKVNLKDFFQRKKAKTFFGFGLSLLFLSLFVRYKLYYLIFGTVFLIFFLVCFFFGKKETTT